MDRRLATRPLSAALVTLLVVAVPAAAHADEPSTWAAGHGFSTLYVLLVFVGGPVGLFVVISLFALIGRHRTYPRPAMGDEAAVDARQQVGEIGFRRPSGEGDEARAAAEAEAVDRVEESRSGGASGSW